MNRIDVQTEQNEQDRCTKNVGKMKRMNRIDVQKCRINEQNEQV